MLGCVGCFGPFFDLGFFWSCNVWKYSATGSSSSSARVSFSGFLSEFTAKSSSEDCSSSEDRPEESELLDEMSGSDESDDSCLVLDSLPVAAV